jgi:seryl-tRNA synthetase
MAQMRPDPITELRRRGEIVCTTGGALIVGGLPLRLMRWVDAQLVQRGGGVTEMQCPALIDRDLLKRADYFESFPHCATRIESMEHSVLLAPAVCYHCFGRLADRRLDAPAAITCAGKCYRHENGAKGMIGRLWEFTMREFVFVATPEAVKLERRAWIERVRSFADLVGLEGKIEVATDPFFGNSGRGGKLLQQIKELKYEFRCAMPDGSKLALASFNLHETFFTSRFGIAMAGAAEPHSACVAFGLERWMLAILGQRGIEATAQLCG